MGLSLQDLKFAMEPLAKIGKSEMSFEVNGIAITLRSLTPEEEIEVQRYARDSISETVESMDITDQWRYLDHFRAAALGYSIVQVGDLDLRNEKFVETGETLKDGTPIKIERYEAMRQMVHGWSRDMSQAVFQKWSELLYKAGQEVDNLFEFDPVDFDSEITRLEDRIRDLREKKNLQEASSDDARDSIRNDVASQKVSLSRLPGSVTVSEPEKGQTDTGEDALELAVPVNIDREILSVEDQDEDQDEPVEEPSPQVDHARGRVPVFARKMAPNTQEESPRPTAAVPTRKVQDLPPPEELPSEPHPSSNDSMPDVMSSFVDMNDPLAAEKAIEAENRRILEMRASRKPPHLAAKEAMQEMQPDPSLQTPSSPTKMGEKDGVEVYRMPTQVLTDRQPPEPPPAPKPARGNINPRFRPIKSSS